MADYSPGMPDPAAQTGDAGDQPGALPRLNGDPTYDQLPVDNTGVVVPLNYYDTSTDTIKYAMPDGSGGVYVQIDHDLSADLSLSADTGIL